MLALPKANTDRTLCGTVTKKVKAVEKGYTRSNLDGFHMASMISLRSRARHQFRDDPLGMIKSLHPYAATGL